MFSPLPRSVPEQEDDVMIVDSDEEEEAPSSSAAATAAAATGATKRKYRDVDTEPSVKRLRTDQSMTPTDDDDDEVMELD